jgi:hypothetical protein
MNNDTHLHEPSSSTISLPPSPIAPESPSASAFLRTAATLEGLARQLEDLKDVEVMENSVEVRCTCGAFSTGRERLEDKLKLSGGMSTSSYLKRSELTKV